MLTPDEMREREDELQRGMDEFNHAPNIEPIPAVLRSWESNDRDTLAAIADAKWRALDAAEAEIDRLRGEVERLTMLLERMPKMTSGEAQIVEAWQAAQEAVDERDAAQADADRLARVLREFDELPVGWTKGLDENWHRLQVIAREALRLHDERTP